MLQPQQVEDLIVLVSSLDKPALIRQFREYPASFPVDFTCDFLDNQPLERLRHLFVAICLQTKQLPHCPANDPAAAA
jgi:hypothetical protein